MARNSRKSGVPLDEENPELNAVCASMSPGAALASAKGPGLLSEVGALPGRSEGMPTNLCAHLNGSFLAKSRGHLRAASCSPTAPLPIGLPVSQSRADKSPGRRRGLPLIELLDTQEVSMKCTKLLFAHKTLFRTTKREHIGREDAKRILDHPPSIIAARSLWDLLVQGAAQEGRR